VSCMWWREVCVGGCVVVVRAGWLVACVSCVVCRGRGSWVVGSQRLVIGHLTKVKNEFKTPK
jgi:hypothetical protein